MIKSDSVIGSFYEVNRKQNNCLSYMFKYLSDVEKEKKHTTVQWIFQWKNSNSQKNIIQIRSTENSRKSFVFKYKYENIEEYQDVITAVDCFSWSLLM